MRPKNQGARREQLKSAARAVLLRRGAVSLRVKDIAEEAGMAPSSVLYYYPDIGDLLLDVARGAMERYAEQRAAMVRQVEGAIGRPAARDRASGCPPAPRTRTAAFSMRSMR